MSIVAISGGVGGAKLALGIYRVLPKYARTIIVNTGAKAGHKVAPGAQILVNSLDSNAGNLHENWRYRPSSATVGSEMVASKLYRNSAYANSTWPWEEHRLSTPSMEVAVGIPTRSSGFRRGRTELLIAGSRVELQNRA